MQSLNNSNAFNAALNSALDSFRATHQAELDVSDKRLEDACVRLAKVGYDVRKTAKSRDMLKAYLAGKSLYVAGPSGVGKTAFFKALTESGVSPRRIVIWSLLEHAEEYASDILENLRSYQANEVLIDDAGCESTWSGRREDDLLMQIIALREQSKCRTHFTTNLKTDVVRERYDKRVYSRLMARECFAIVGADNRQSEANTALVSQADRANWSLCADRCPRYQNGKCLEGRTVPPLAMLKTPEEVCGVGEKIPYSAGYEEREAAWERYHAQKLTEILRPVS